jgi:hypothetical protein
MRTSFFSNYLCLCTHRIQFRPEWIQYIYIGIKSRITRTTANFDHIQVFNNKILCEYIWIHSYGKKRSKILLFYILVIVQRRISLQRHSHSYLSLYTYIISYSAIVANQTQQVRNVRTFFLLGFVLKPSAAAVLQKGSLMEQSMKLPILNGSMSSLPLYVTFAGTHQFRFHVVGITSLHMFVYKLIYNKNTNCWRLEEKLTEYGRKEKGSSVTQ